MIKKRLPNVVAKNVKVLRNGLRNQLLSVISRIHDFT